MFTARSLPRLECLPCTVQVAPYLLLLIKNYRSLTSYVLYSPNESYISDLWKTITDVLLLHVLLARNENKLIY